MTRTDLHRRVRDLGWRVLRRFPPERAFDDGLAETLIEGDPDVDRLLADLGAEAAAALLASHELVTTQTGWGDWCNAIVPQGGRP